MSAGAVRNLQQQMSKMSKRIQTRKRGRRVEWAAGGCAGAFFAQLLAIHQDVVHTLVLGGILGAVAWAHRGQFPNN